MIPTLFLALGALALPQSGVMTQAGPEFASCSPSIDSVALAGASKNIPGTLKESDVRNHVDWVFKSPLARYASNTKTSFSCVDSRSDDPMFGTPGGDLCEFAIALTVYFKSIGKTATLEDIRSLFRIFLSTEITEKRPFYFHTDDTRLRRVFKKMTTALGRTITILPNTRPTDESEANKWLDELTESYAQGCGHVRLMINDPATYGLENNFIIKSLIRVFYEEWWARSKADKRIFNFSVKLGPLIGGAIAIVDNVGPACKNASPMLSPNVGGSSVFVYHPNAVAAFRESVLVPFFTKKNKALSNTQFLKGVTELFGTQLTATLTNLAPANATDLFAVNVKTQ